MPDVDLDAKRYYVDNDPPHGFGYKWVIRDRAVGDWPVRGAWTEGTAERICCDLNERGFSEAWH